MKTHCRNGHEWNALNVGIARRHGVESEYCKACARDVQRRIKAYKVEIGAPKVPKQVSIRRNMRGHVDRQHANATPSAQRFWDQYVAQKYRRKRFKCDHPLRKDNVICWPRRNKGSDYTYITAVCRICHSRKVQERAAKAAGKITVWDVIQPAWQSEKDKERERIAQALEEFTAQ